MFLELLDGICPVMKNGRSQGGIRLAFREHAREIVGLARSAGCNYRDMRGARNGPGERAIESLLDAVADGSSVERQKPAPDLFLHAAGLLGLPPEECLVVEDAAAGIEAARAGGFHILGLGPPERVGDADIVFESLEGAKLEAILNLLEDSSDKQTDS